MQMNDLTDWISAYLVRHPELLKAKYRSDTGRHPMTGHCYVASEALYHLRPDLDLHPVAMRVGDDVHWWLVDDDGNDHDITRGQFGGTVVEFEGTGRGFLTKKPSRRAQQVIDAFRREHPGQYKRWVRDLWVSVLEEENRELTEELGKDLLDLYTVEKRLGELTGKRPILH